MEESGPKNAPQPKAYLQLYISCIGLPTLSTSTNGEAFAVASTKNSEIGPWFILGKTEKVPNTRNPEFTSTFRIEYKFQERQFVKIEIREGSSISTESTTIGICDLELGDLVGKKDKMVVLDILPEDPNDTSLPSRGKIIARIEKLGVSKKTISFDMKGNALTNFGWMAALNPMIRIYKPFL